MLYKCLLLTLKTPLHIFRAELYRKTSPKDFEANGFPCCILNNTHFFWNQSRKSKKFHDVRKSGEVSKQNGICRRYVFMMRIMYDEDYVWWGLCIPSFRTIAYVVDKQSGIYRRYLLLQGSCVKEHSVLKTTAKQTRLYQI